MLYANHNHDFSVIETALRADTFIHTAFEPMLSIRCLSTRCLESQLEGSLNQDFVRLVISRRTASLCFCVCDGVGSSYQGHFAARYLARRLVKWLQILPQIPQDPSIVLPSLRSSFSLWADSAHQTLSQLSLPAGLSAWEREIIHEQRDLYGSGTVFLCGRIDYAPATAMPQYMPALFCWMGNVTGYSFSGRNQYKELGDHGEDTNRWSTRRGSQGKITVCTSTLHRPDPLVVHTDGLDALGPELIYLDDEELSVRMRSLLQQPRNDDMTLLKLSWNTF
ncbi:hypothetical protein KDH_55580 [Dictyobacter sp. S3.2.2.5]|uniref:PPM-type phosphatase domain-containing protein n=1 Tax=Dictyobacter halimunensis TaxID=3026934 RepID=A0ABQ6FWT3_9CHLR|nr:hypothetical protein KDH_55580 [Dictyobacter sp. S3.2.2.5]